MSFNDKLFQAGLINKKQLRKMNQKSKLERKAKQGNKKKKKVLEAESKAKTRQEKQERLERLKKERHAREQVHMAAARKRQVQQILNHHRLRFRKADFPFWHLTFDKKHAHKLWVPERTAWELRSGLYAIALMGDANAKEPAYVVIPRDIVERIVSLEPSRILFFNEKAPPKDDPAERLWGTD
ncbi:MAG: DUF2058 family protein [Myxococcota bacterium]|nr:DUF2058 family protein [Myxococcota bacterium]